jgi:hypothetical protein
MPAPPGIYPAVATAARMYDHYLSGHDNFAADRIAALKVMEAAPEVRCGPRRTADSSAARSGSWSARPESGNSWTWAPACPPAATSTRSPSS